MADLLHQQLAKRRSSALMANRSLLADPITSSGNRHLVRQILNTSATAPVIQPRLKIGPVNDRYEQEADRIADQVMNITDSQLSGIRPIEQSATNPVQRLCTQCEEEEEMVQPKSKSNEQVSAPADVSSGIEGLTSGGHSLPQKSKAFFEPRFGQDFSQVKIHTSDHAERLAGAINARAFTYGNHIVFGRGEFQPDTDSGKRLMGHELTHVVQQAGMTDNAPQRDVIRRTTVGQILNEFFSPFSSPRMWVMEQNDNYTRIVRTWEHVINAVNVIKADLEANCSQWQTSRMTDTA